MNLPTHLQSSRYATRTTDILRNIPFFACLSQEELSEIHRLLSIKRVAKNQIILYEEDTPYYMYVVYFGKVRVVHLSDDGKERILAIHKRGDFFGEMGLLDGKTEPASVIAMDDTTIGLLARKDFEKFVLKNNHVLLQIISLLCGRFRELLLMLKAMSFANAEQRLKEVLLNLTKLYGIKDTRGILIALNLTHKDLASYASISRETATRILGKFTKMGDIEFLENKNILIKNSFFNDMKNKCT